VKSSSKLSNSLATALPFAWSPIFTIFRNVLLNFQQHILRYFLKYSIENAQIFHHLQFQSHPSPQGHQRFCFCSCISTFVLRESQKEAPCGLIKSTVNVRTTIMQWNCRNMTVYHVRPWALSRLQSHCCSEKQSILMSKQVHFCGSSSHYRM